MGPAPFAALAAAAIGGLGALHLEARAPWPDRAEPGHDGVTVAYLRAFVDRHPRDAAMRLRLAREQLALGMIRDAERTLAPLLEAVPTREVLALALEVDMAAWRAAPAGTRERAGAEASALARLALLSGRSETPAELAHVGVVARELERPDLAARAGERAADLDRPRCARWLSEAARDYLAAGDPGSAGASYARAHGCSDDPGTARELGLAALDAYVAADERAGALRLADLLVERFSTDRAVLERAEGIALANQDADRARRFGARLVETGAVEAVSLRRQLDLDLAAGDLDHALRVANRLVERAPGDPRSRLSAANVATWAGRRRVALRHWMWLARHGDAFGGADRALRLARAVEDDAAVVEILMLQSRDGPLPSAALAELGGALERLGPPRSAIAALQDHAARHPGSRVAWEELAAVQERGRDLSAALATRIEIARRFGSSPASSLHVARLHRALGRPGDALAELRRWSDSADPGEGEYWKLLAEVAWERSSDDLAARAYEALWDGGRVDVVGAERLVLLSREAGRADDVIRYGREGWSRLGEPRLLLLAMDEAARAGRWDDLARLAREAVSAEGDFARFPAYWMLRARVDERAGRIAQAADHYRRALGVDPRSAAGRSGLIWLFVAAREREALSRCLAAWAADAQDDPALWRAYAAGLAALGRRREALAFHEREARAVPGDADAQERWAAALRLAHERPAATLAAELRVQSFGPVVLRRLGTAARSELPGAEVEVRAGTTDFTSSDRTLPLDRRSAEVAVRATSPLLGGRTELAAGLDLRRDENVLQGALAHTRALASFAEARIEASVNEQAAESAALLVDGVRTRAGGALTLAAGPVYGRSGAEWKSWSTRAGTSLGTGGAGTVEVGVRARAADPEVRVRLQGGYQRNRFAAGAAPSLAALAPGAPIVPDELSAVGLGAGLARWRVGPALLTTDAWLGWLSPPSRPALRVEAGLAIAPSGHTELSLTGFAANDRFGVGRGDVGASVSLAYRLPR